MSTFGQRLREEIAVHGMSEAEFSRQSGFSDSNVSHYISGQRAPGIESLANMLRVLPNADARWLVTGKK